MNHEARVQILFKHTRKFPSRLKQAMFSAASHQMIKRGTWDGCAFNAAGSQAGDDNVKSYFTAASAFGVSETKVRTFITTWDNLDGSDEECNLALREALTDSNLFEEPSRIIRVQRHRVWAFKETEEKEEFEALVKDLDFSNEEDTLVQDTKLVSELLTMGSD